MLASGSLNRRVLIQQQTTQQDGYGQQQSVWSDYRSAWASVRTATSKEVYAASGFVSQLTHIITIRYNAALPVTHGMQVEFRGRTFLVQAVSAPNEDLVQQDLLCMERNDGR